MQPAPLPRAVGFVLLFVVVTTDFALVYCQAPLYYSNQNQYFLHGLARAGYGQLDEDWLANTDDPTPVFSGLVEFTVRYLHPFFFHLFYALLQGAYALAMLGLFAFVAGGQGAARRWPVFLTLFFVLHSAVLRWASYHWLGLDYPWYFQAGVAGQYVLGAMFQPSTFGVLLVVAVYLFVRGQPFLAGACVALAVTFHSTYLLPGALLTLGFVTALGIEGRWRQGLALGAWTLALVQPVTAYVLVTFRPSCAETFHEAQHILAQVRIPHHARVDLWLDWIAGLQIAWVVLALVLVGRSRLLPVLGVPFALAAVLTAAQAATGSDTLALLFPWRISAVLVPVATTIILSRLVALAPVSPSAGGLAGLPAATAVVMLLVLGGMWIMITGQGFRSNDEEEGVLEFVREHRQPGEVYFIPVDLRNLVQHTRGSLSSDFKPLEEKKKDPRLIPLDFQRFRLPTGAPIFVDFKSIPYKDTDVIEWYHRIKQAQAVQEHLQKGRLSEALAILREHKITRLVQRVGQELSAPGLKRIYRDQYYEVYRLQGETLRPGKT